MGINVIEFSVAFTNTLDLGFFRDAWFDVNEFGDLCDRGSVFAALAWERHLIYTKYSLAAKNAARLL